jgi:hypothetical protein
MFCLWLVLRSAHKMYKDNNVFFEYNPYWFFIKDQDTWEMILEEICENGLYPIQSMHIFRTRHQQEQ